MTPPLKQDTESSPRHEGRQVDVTDGHSAKANLSGRKSFELPLNLKFENPRQPLKLKPGMAATDDAVQITGSHEPEQKV
jgi:hypothetical protein